MTRKEFADALLVKLNAPRSAHNRRALVAWMQTEGYGGRNNPLNTTLKMPGSTTFNSHGVQNYVSEIDGVNAAARTLTEGQEEWGYDRIIRRLQKDAEPDATLRALVRSSWGTTDLVFDVLEDVLNDFKAMAEQPASAQ